LVSAHKRQVRGSLKIELISIRLFTKLSLQRARIVTDQRALENSNAAADEQCLLICLGNMPETRLGTL